MTDKFDFFNDFDSNPLRGRTTIRGVGGRVLTAPDDDCEYNPRLPFSKSNATHCDICGDWETRELLHMLPAPDSCLPIRFVCNKCYTQHLIENEQYDLVSQYSEDSARQAVEEFLQKVRSNGN